MAYHMNAHHDKEYAEVTKRESPKKAKLNILCDHGFSLPIIFLFQCTCFDVRQYNQHVI